MIREIFTNERTKKNVELVLLGIICCNFFLPVINFFGVVYGSKAFHFWTTGFAKSLFDEFKWDFESVLRILMLTYFNLMYWTLGIFLLLRFFKKRYPFFNLVLISLAFVSASYWFVVDVFDLFESMYFGFYVAYIPLIVLLILQIITFRQVRKEKKVAQMSSTSK